MRQNQRGFGLIELSIVLAFVTAFLIQGLPLIEQNRINEDAKTLKKQVTFLWEVTKRYQADRFNSGMSVNDVNTLPRSVDALMPDYLQACTVSNFEDGQCKRIDYTPIGDRITLNRRYVTLATGQTVPGMQIIVSFQNEPDGPILNTYLTALSDLPNGQYDSTAKQFTVEFGRVGSEVEHEALLQRDGSTALTGADWDTGGNTWITNIKGMFLRNTDGSQYSVASGLNRILIAKSGTFIPRHQCPANHTPKIDVMIKSIEPFSDGARFSSLGSFTPYYVDAPGGWRVYAKYYGKLQTGAKHWKLLNNAYLKVTQMCVL